MVRVKWRWALACGHLLIDCILLVALVAYSNRIYRGDKGPLRPPAPVKAAMLLQEGGSIELDLRTSEPPPGPFIIIMSGNPLAGLMSGILRSAAGSVGRWRPWDPTWFALHEAFSFPCWFLIGAWIDAGRFRLRKVMLAYLFARLLIALTGFYEVGWRIQVLFWWGLVFWLLGFGLFRLIKVGLHAAKRA